MCVFFPIDDNTRYLVAFRRYSRSCGEVVRNGAEISCFGPPNFEDKWPPKFLTEFDKFGSPSNMWQSLVTIGQATYVQRTMELACGEDTDSFLDFRLFSKTLYRQQKSDMLLSTTPVSLPNGISLSVCINKLKWENRRRERKRFRQVN